MIFKAPVSKNVEWDHAVTVCLLVSMHQDCSVATYGYLTPNRQTHSNTELASKPHSLSQAGHTRLMRRLWIAISSIDITVTTIQHRNIVPRYPACVHITHA